MTPVNRHNWKVYAHDKATWTEVLTAMPKILGTGDVYNPEIACTLVDKRQNGMK